MHFGPTVYILKVSLHNIKPMVWRRIVVPSEMPLPKFAQQYPHLLRALADTTDEDHARMVSWAPEGFDPADFA